MAQIYSNWTAPTFSFDLADHPTTWRDFYYRAQDYLELLRIRPEEEDQEKWGWEQLTTMFTGESRQIRQTPIDNNTITETDQRTPLLALKAIQSAIKNKEHHRTSTTMATKSATTTTKTRSNTKCPWKQFYKRIIKYMDSLHEEQCEPQMKIYTFIHAIRNSFPIENSTKQTQTTETTNSETDSAYNTDTESSYTPQTENTNFSSLQDHTKHLTRPSTDSQSTASTSTRTHPSTSTHQPKPSTSTRQNTQTTTKQPTEPAPKTSTASRKSPLLPTPPAPRKFNYSNHFHQHTTRPSAFNNRNPAFTRPSTFYNRVYQQHIPRPSPSSRHSTYPMFSGPASYRYYLQPHIPGPYTAFPPYLHQNFFTGPYQQIPGHFPQIYYLPVILQHPIQHLTP